MTNVINFPKREKELSNPPEIFADYIFQKMGEYVAFNNLDDRTILEAIFTLLYEVALHLEENGDYDRDGAVAKVCTDFMMFCAMQRTKGDFNKNNKDI